jgi:putative transposase
MVIDDHHAELAQVVGKKGACLLLGRPRATHYRRCKPTRPSGIVKRPAPPNALAENERQVVLDLLHRPEHADLAVAQVWSRTLDDGIYLCSQSTMHRLLRANGESGERRRQRTHPAKKKPELMATGPNEIWSWDISKLKGPTKGEYYDLYCIIDIFSRYVPQWLVAEAESAELASDFLEDAVLAQGVDRGTLTIHADRGSSMRSKPVSQLLIDLGVARSHSRPHVSNDNPYSEAAFKTLKYCPEFPKRFGSIEHARAFCAEFFEHYNHIHRHSGIGLHTPASLHYGTAAEIREQRQATLSAAFNDNPIRFRHRPPVAPLIPEVAWINEPAREEIAQNS